ncbi:MAG TPA: PIG-L family deacetylase [Actinomycetaceae bacterium]|nr:PIG-L family deacetylase [Actinomycetaceae bacterium]
MTRDPWHLLEEAGLVLAVHAHPDDESLSTGALLASLATASTRVELVTATRGEEGEVVAGAIAPADRRPLEEVRTAEIDAATAALGIAARHMLGSPPALAGDAEPREYRDSGMRWVREGLAGPAATAGPTSFTHRPRGEAVDDLVALIRTLRPDAVIGYDDEGSYGHPDHVHAHHVTVIACEATGTSMIEVASDPESTGFSWREQRDSLAAVQEALRAYRTQLTVLGVEEAGLEHAGRIRIRHVGGQEDAIDMRTGLRLRG